MNIKEVLDIFLILAITIVTTCIVLITYFFIKTLNSLEELSEHLKNVTSNFAGRAGLKFLSMVPPLMVALIGKLFKRGRG